MCVCVCVVTHPGLRFHGSVPRHLALQLKRFDMDWARMVRVKLMDQIEVRYGF